MQFDEHIEYQVGATENFKSTINRYRLNISGVSCMRVTFKIKSVFTDSFAFKVLPQAV